MKESVRKRIRVTAAVLLVCVLFCVSCAKTPQERWFSDGGQNLTAVLEGNMNGTEFRCETEYRNGVLVRVTYSAPEVLNGLSVCPEENGTCRISQNGIEAVFPAEKDPFCALLAPARMLVPKNPEILSVRKYTEGTEWKLSVSGLPELTLQISPEGIPQVVSGENITYRVAEFRKTAPVSAGM